MSTTNSDIQKKAMIKAMEKSLGIVKTACESVGIARSTHYLWLEQDDKYRDEMKDVLELKRDFVESKLLKLVDQGDTAATIFASKALLKNRGYVERQEITGADAAPIIIINEKI